MSDQDVKDKDTESGDKKASKEVVEELNSGFDEVAAIASDVAGKVGALAGEGYHEAKEQWKKLEPHVKEKLGTAGFGKVAIPAAGDKLGI